MTNARRRRDLTCCAGGKNTIGKGQTNPDSVTLLCYSLASAKAGLIILLPAGGSQHSDSPSLITKGQIGHQCCGAVLEDKQKHDEPARRRFLSFCPSVGRDYWMSVTWAEMEESVIRRRRTHRVGLLNTKCVSFRAFETIQHQIQTPETEPKPLRLLSPLLWLTIPGIL